jgi:transcriptional regulator with XRE-family HTH domain
MKTRLKELMQEKGVMSKTLAEKIGISEVSFSALVNGKSNNLETLAKAAQCLGVEMWELFASFEDVINSPANTLIPKTDNGDPILPPYGDDFPRSSENTETRCPHCGKLLHITIK